MTKVDAKTAPATARAPAGQAVEGIRALQSELAALNPRYADAVKLERDAENFCRDVRLGLRENRRAQGLDQADIARMLDLTQSAVSKIESGEGDIGLKTVFRYAYALGLIPVCTFLPDSSRLFPQVAAGAAKAVQDFQTGLVKDTSQALANAVAGFARSFSEDEAGRHAAAPVEAEAADTEAPPAVAQDEA